MNILYLHGYGSSYDSESTKVVALKTLGTVHGIDFNYGHGSTSVIESGRQACMDNDIDLIMGCSMGGWLASHLSESLGLPFVGLNPAINPAASLLKYVGEVVNYGSGDHEIDTETVSAYPEISRKGYGLIFLEEGDDVIDPLESEVMLRDDYPVHLFPGGSHRFESLGERIPIIRAFLHTEKVKKEGSD